ncbi:MAG: guanylate kinase [Oscillospiraceae bacterium]|nr:guanylate kinase [Oscillospiraceae bacterium]
MNKKGLLLVFSGPSGVGKGTVLKEYLKAHPNTAFSVSATTRSPREGEVHGRHYFFLSHEEFQSLIEKKGFLEHAQFAGNHYGTPRKAVEESLEKGIDVVLEIEVQGALQVKNQNPDAVLVFVMPPSFEELHRRLAGRGTEDAATVERRLSNAAREMEAAKQYDYIIVNQTVEEAASQLEQIVCAAKHTAGYLNEFIEEVEDDAKTCCK